MPEIEATLLPESEVSHDASPSANATGCRRWKATSTPRISVACMSASCSRSRSDPTTGCKYQVVNRAPGLSGGGYRLGHDVLRLPSGRRWPDLLAVRAFRLSVLDIDSAGRFRRSGEARAWVPMDDTHVMFVGFTWKQAVAHRRAEGWRADPGSTPALDYQPTARTGSGRWRPVSECGERLSDRSRGAAERRDLHWDHAYRDAGPGDHRNPTGRHLRA